MPSGIYHYPLSLRNDEDPQRLYGSFEFHSRGMQGKSYKCRSRLTREEHICRHICRRILKFVSKSAAHFCVWEQFWMYAVNAPNSQVALPKFRIQIPFRVISTLTKIWDPIFLLNFLPRMAGKFARTKFQLHRIW